MSKNFPILFKNVYIIAFSAWVWTFLAPVSSAQDLKERISYKLAILQLREENPENVLLQKPLIPDSAMVTEFQWILDSLKTRCLNPETAIADTIVENWTIQNKAGGKLSLLETARELSLIARNTKLFGPGKVNFRKTSQYWLKQKFGKTTGKS